MSTRKQEGMSRIQGSTRFKKKRTKEEKETEEMKLQVRIKAGG